MSSAPAPAPTHGSDRKANYSSSHPLTGTPKMPAGMSHQATNQMTPDASAAASPTTASAAMPDAPILHQTPPHSPIHTSLTALPTPPSTKSGSAANAATDPASITSHCTAPKTLLRNQPHPIARPTPQIPSLTPLNSLPISATASAISATSPAQLASSATATQNSTSDPVTISMTTGPSYTPALKSPKMAPPKPSITSSKCTKACASKTAAANSAASPATTPTPCPHPAKPPTSTDKNASTATRPNPAPKTPMPDWHNKTHASPAICPVAAQKTSPMSLKLITALSADN